MAAVVVGVVGACAVAERAVAGWALEGLLEASTASSLMPLDFACGEETGRGEVYGGYTERLYPTAARGHIINRTWQGMPGEGRLGGFGRGAGLLREEGGQD